MQHEINSAAQSRHATPGITTTTAANSTIQSLSPTLEYHWPRIALRSLLTFT